MILRKPVVAVAMSGGVDSSVALATLKNDGYDVIGMTLLLKSAGHYVSGSSCTALTDIEDAERIAKRLGVDHHVVDCQSEFETHILKEAWKTYKSGRTPNPCVLCNHIIKFGYLFDRANELGADKLATGHYARIERLQDKGDDIEYCLLRGLDKQKDQSYFLAMLTQEQLARTILPLGTMTKSQVKKSSVDLNLDVSHKRESQDTCIALSGETFPETLRQYFHEKCETGEIVNTSGKTIGKHHGIHQFTIGQRKGLRVALGYPVYVIEIDAQKNRIVVSGNKNDLLTETFLVPECHWIRGKPPAREFDATAQIRYLHKAAPVKLTVTGKTKVNVRFREPQRAVTPGQAAVFYRDDQVLGGGWIDRK
ncbi:tRNA 2-thiouridine(34) synthase MnmA [bacterium]|nr:tRNA 2-thiouridine(34) synthase MnmA [candidate division CSSED10-310 bacterium]